MDSDGDGEIDLHEFERAIRRFRRATNSKAVAKEKEGRAIAQRLLQKLQERVIPMVTSELRVLERMVTGDECRRAFSPARYKWRWACGWLRVEEGAGRGGAGEEQVGGCSGICVKGRGVQ